MAAYEILQLLHLRTGKAQTSMCIWAISPGSSILAYIKYVRGGRFRSKFAPLAQLDGGYVISPKFWPIYMYLLIAVVDKFSINPVSIPCWS